ncbi:MAG: hypothetical protein U0525_00765 [Patescibacteria group bacterium]
MPVPLAEKLPQRGRETRPRFIDFEPRAGIASTIADQYRRFEAANRWSLAVDLPNTSGLSNYFEPEKEITIREDKQMLSWDGLSSILRTSAGDSKDEKDRERVNQLSKIASACVRLEATLKAYNENHGKKLPVEQKRRLDLFLGDRNTQDIDNDTYFKHGARCASYVFDMGITDPYAFAVAGLHDLAELLAFHQAQGLSIGKTSVRNVVINQLKTAMSGVDIDVDQLVVEITRFAQADVERQQMAVSSFDNLPEEFSVGKEFGWKEFVNFQSYIAAEHTNTPRLVSVTGKLDYRRANLTGDVVGQKLLPNAVQVLQESNTHITPRSARRKGKSLPTSPALHIAELASALDHSYFPKKPKPGETPEDRLKNEQVYATGLMTTLFPIYQAYGDPPRRLALEVIYRAFMPNSLSNIYKAVSETAEENGGAYVDSYDDVYSSEVLSLVKRYLVFNPHATLVSDREMEARRLAYTLNKDEKRPILDQDEINVAGLDVDENGGGYTMHMNRKSAASTMNKILGLLADPKKSAKLDPEIYKYEFGSVDFWKYLLPRFHDFLRTQMTLGQSQRDIFIAFLTGHFSTAFSYEDNLAESVYYFDSQDERMREFVENKVGSLNVIFAHNLPNVNTNVNIRRINCEVHAIGADEDVRRELEVDPSQRAAYKARNIIEDQLKPLAPTDDVVRQMRRDYAKEAIIAREKYLLMVFNTEQVDDVSAKRSGRVYKRKKY